MQPKPDFLGPEYAMRFQNQSVVDRYHLRPSYPPETFRILSDLIVDEPRVLLDVGCGTGDVGRNLLEVVERIDAVDISLPMMEKGKALPGGSSPKIRWLHGSIEDIPLSPPYALVTAGQSLHWMNWDVVLPRFAHSLTSHGMLAIVDTEVVPVSWSKDITKIVRQYSTNPTYQPINLIEELEKRHLFQKEGDARTVPVSFEQSVQNSIEGFHAMSSLSRDHMTCEMAAAFDEEIREVLTAHAQDGKVSVQVVGHVVWGRPQKANR